MAKKRVATTPEGARAIGERLAGLRKAKGLTQVDVAGALGLAQGLVSKYETGDLLRTWIAPQTGHTTTAARFSA